MGINRTRKPKVCAQDVKDLGFRSKFEYVVNKQLMEAGIRFDYEGKNNTVYFIKPAEVKRYVSDFLLENGIIVEAKGYFDAPDRKKHMLIKEQYPFLDIRILFMNSNTKLSKRSRTTYGEWCDKVGIIYADKVVPDSWINHKKPKADLRMIKRALQSMGKTYALENYANYGDMNNG